MGFVQKVESFGVIIAFRDSLTALAPRPNLADHFVSSPVGLFNVGDAVRCVVQRVDLSKDRVIVTFKSTIVPPSSGPHNFLHSLLHERVLASTSAVVSASAAATADGGDVAASAQFWRIGAVTTATVSAIKKYGVVMIGPDQVTILLARGAHADRSVSVGDSVSVCVLDIDLAASVLNVSMVAGLVGAVSAASGAAAGVAAEGKQSKKASKKKLQLTSTAAAFPYAVDSVVPATVQLVKDKYVIASVADDAHLVYVMVADYHCPFREATEADYSIGSVIRVKVESVPIQQQQVKQEAKEAPLRPHSRTLHAHLPVASVQTEQSSRRADNASAAAGGGGDGAGAAGGPGGAGDSQAAKSAVLRSIELGRVSKWEVKAIGDQELKLLPQVETPARLFFC